MITKDHISNAAKPTGDKGRDTLVRMNEGHDELTNWALSFLEITEASNILDIGCGGGATIQRLLKKYEMAFVDGIDYSEESIKLSKEFNKEILGKSCNVVQGDVHELPYENNYFDLITGFETVYFWKDIKKALSEVKRVMKPNGKFLICCEMSDKNNPKWVNILDEMRIFDEKEWIEELGNSGFIVEKSGNKGEWIYLISKC